MNIITFTGPPASGKDTIIDGLLQKCNQGFPNRFSKSIYYSTREKRPTDIIGQNIFLISKEEFILKSEDKQIVSTDVSNGDYVGHSIDELSKTEFVFASISKKNIPELREIVKKNNGLLITCYIDVPLETRKFRLIKRADSIDPNYVESKIKNGVGYVPQSERTAFDKVFENPEGKLEETIDSIYSNLIRHLNLA